MKELLSKIELAQKKLNSYIDMQRIITAETHSLLKLAEELKEITSNPKEITIPMPTSIELINLHPVVMLKAMNRLDEYKKFIRFSFGENKEELEIATAKGANEEIIPDMVTINIDMKREK